MKNINNITTKEGAYEYLDQEVNKLDKIFQNGESPLDKDLEKYQENYIFLRKKFYLNRNGSYKKFEDLLIKMDKKITKSLKETYNELISLKEIEIKSYKQEIKNLKS